MKRILILLLIFLLKTGWSTSDSSHHSSTNDIKSETSPKETKIKATLNNSISWSTNPHHHHINGTHQPIDCRRLCRHDKNCTSLCDKKTGSKDIKRKTDKKSNEKKSNQNYLLQTNSKNFLHQNNNIKNRNLKSKKQKRRKIQQNVKPLIYYKLMSLKKSAPMEEPFANVEGTLRTAGNGQLDAKLTWELKKEAKDTKKSFFQVYMARTTCNLHPGYPYCDESERLIPRMVTSKSHNGSTIFHGLNYNSKYWLEVVYKDVSSHRIWLNTAPCKHFYENNFTVCLDNTSNLTESKFLASQPGSWLRPDITCQYYDKIHDTAHVWLDWARFDTLHHSTTESPYKINTENNELDAKETTSDHSNLTENVVLVTSNMKFNNYLQLYHPTTPYMHLKLKPDFWYKVKIKRKVSDYEIIFNDVFIKVDREAPMNATCNSMFNDLNINKQDSWFIYTMVLAISTITIVVISASFAIYCRRCKKAHTKLLKKTLMAKNNSYKTAPGTRVVYMKEEREQEKDEWELEAREVTLGAEIGQGAFGFVMTGYYRECQVAIKVLKGDVSPSYRDELLREIKILKIIGSHSNIVSLVGACTIKDPIALIMEYMPFGNLQLFLQKCCLEGELQKTDNGSEMTFCPTDHLTGVKEILYLTSTDLLSFARQISLAMEFITNRRFVHRDLAARNVLVTTNKVVKLCDFGLARMVCNGDQYCKLTNGRLPFKWMALESIKDRIFTVQSDVWSFGVFLWEITTFGSTPYPDVALVDLYRLLSEGYRMPKPANCSNELYHLMSCCWREDPQERPTFSSIKQQLEVMLAQKENYLDLDHLTSSLPQLKRPSTPCDRIEERAIVKKEERGKRKGEEDI